MTKTNDPILIDLKKLLRRLEKIDPETREKAQDRSFRPTASNALKLQNAVLEEGKEHHSAGDGLLQLQTRRKGQTGETGQSTDLPVIVNHSFPVATEPEKEFGALRVVVIASVTAAIVSALATGGTVYWLNGGAGGPGFLAPTHIAEQPPRVPAGQPARTTINPFGISALETAQTANAAAATAPPTSGQPSNRAIEGLVPQVATGSASTTLFEPIPVRPRLATGQATDDQIPANSGQPRRAEATFIAGAASNGLLGEPVTILSAATELAATLSATGAVASESLPSASLREAQSTRDFSTATAIDPSQGFNVASEDTTTATDAAATHSAPLVAVYEAPENTLPWNCDQSATPQNVQDKPGALSVKSEEGQAQDQPLPVNPDEVALVHPEQAALANDEAVKLPMTVSGPAEELVGHYLIVSGLKRGSRMSSGVELMFDTWRIDVAKLNDLQLVVPAGFGRRMHLDIELRRADGTAREKSSLVIAMPGAAAQIAQDTDDDGGLDPNVRRDVDQGEVQIDNGNLQGARILFKRAAANGSARAAMLLGGSYDPSLIAAYKTAIPPKADVAEARRWYQRAIELGGSRANQALKQLP